jgi:hypothetical protein
MNLKEVAWEDVDWIYMADGWQQWAAFVNKVMKFLAY